MRLIDKEKLCGLLADKALEAQLEDECTELAVKECLSVVRQMPEAVVRCRECVNCLIDNTERKYHLCMRNNSVFPRKVDLMDFCSYGERKGGADNG